MKFNNMQDLREELDLLDNELIVLISKRFKLIEQAAIIKDDKSKIRDNERIENIISRLRGLAKDNSISADIVEEYTTNVGDAIIIIAQYQYEYGFVVDKEICVAAMLNKLLKL